MSAPLNGVGPFGIHLPPASECWPELSADSDAVLRRTRAPRRYGFRALAYSGEANPNRSYCLPPVSAPLNGVGPFGIHLPPASECWPELRADSQLVLLRTASRRRTAPPSRTCSGEDTSYRRTLSSRYTITQTNKKARTPTSRSLVGVLALIHNGVHGIFPRPYSSCKAPDKSDPYYPSRTTRPSAASSLSHPEKAAGTPRYCAESFLSSASFFCRPDNKPI